MNLKEETQKRRNCETVGQECIRFIRCCCSQSWQGVAEDQNRDSMLQETLLKWPHIMIGTLFRWPDLLDELGTHEQVHDQFNFQMKPLQSNNCSILKKHPNALCSKNDVNCIEDLNDDGFDVCCNPFHWSRIHQGPHSIPTQDIRGNVNFRYLYINKKFQLK